jgi:hypothetical protein
MMCLSRPFCVFFLLAALCLGACTREDDPDTTALYEGMDRGLWEVRLHTRGATDLTESWQGYTFTFDNYEGLFVERGTGIDDIYGDFRAREGNGQTWLEMEFSPASECDSLAGRWQTLSISNRRADFARRVAHTGELERLQFGQ